MLRNDRLKLSCCLLLSLAFMAQCRSSATAGAAPDDSRVDASDSSIDVLNVDSSVADSSWQDHVTDAGEVLDTTSGLDSADATLDPVSCVQNWPVSPNATSKPSLNKIPALLWKTTVPLGGYLQQIVFNGTKLAVVAGNTLCLVDRDGKITGKYAADDAQELGAPIADVEGNFFVGGLAYRKIDPNGQEMWRSVLGENLLSGHETTVVSNSIMSPDGVVYFAASDKNLYALRTKDGGLVWKRAFPMVSTLPWVGPGIGDRLFVNSMPVLASDGKLLEPFGMNGKPFTSIGAVGYSAFLVGWYTWNGGAPPSAHVLDPCGKKLWDFPAKAYSPSLVGFSDELITAGAEGKVYVFDPGGKLLKGPVGAVGPRVLGADGTAYSIACSDSSAPEKSTMDIVAYSSKFVELYRVGLGAPCGFMSPILADDGILYFARLLQPFGVEVLAIQTKSPGLANTAQSTSFHDNRKSGWVM